MLWHGNHHVSTMQIIRGAVELIEKPNIKPTILITGTRKIRFSSVQHHGLVWFGLVLCRQNVFHHVQFILMIDL